MTQWDSGGMAPQLLNLGTRQGQVVSFTREMTNPVQPTEQEVGWASQDIEEYYISALVIYPVS
jgi:hypothetical protein